MQKVKSFSWNHERRSNSIEITFMKDMISLFKDIAVADTSFNTVMVDSFEKEEDGLDNSGVFLDAL